MPKHLSTLSLIATLCMSSVIFAQEAAETDTTTVETEASESVVETDLDLGEEINKDPAYIKEQYGDWQQKCFRTEADEDPCQMYQLLHESAGNPIAEVSIFRLPEGSQAVAGATIVVPLGTLLSEELKIEVDGNLAKSYAYSFCSAVGCVARVGFVQADIDAFRAGAEATLTIVPAQAPDQVVKINASLSGFTTAYENTSIISNP